MRNGRNISAASAYIDDYIKNTNDKINVENYVENTFKEITKENKKSLISFFSKLSEKENYEDDIIELYELLNEI